MSKSKNKGILDLLGISTSIVCAIHCILPPVIMSYTALGTIPFIDNIGFEISILISAVVFAGWSLIPSYKIHCHRGPVIIAALGVSLFVLAHLAHGSAIEVVVLLIGGTLLSTAHYWNWKLKNSPLSCRISTAS